MRLLLSKRTVGKKAFFVGLILLGALILMLPISSQSRTVTPFSDCLFTAVSSTCVTGLVVRDTATHWSLFGQSVIFLPFVIKAKPVRPYVPERKAIAVIAVDLGLFGLMMEAIDIRINGLGA